MPSVSRSARNYHSYRGHRSYRRTPLFAALFCLGSLSFVVLQPVYAQTLPQELPQEITVLRLDAEPIQGTYREMKNDGRMRWYFCNSALLPWANKTNQVEIKAYLDQFLSHVDVKKGTVTDFVFSDAPPPGSPAGTPKRPAPIWQTMPQDADDSNTSTFLSLAAKYRLETGDKAWWDAHLATMKTMTTETLLKQQKASGLIRAKTDGSNAGSTGYLMDNCENYKGLVDFGGLLSIDEDPFSARCLAAASRVAAGIAGLFDKTKQKFNLADIPGSDGFYPDRMAQMFPQLLAVPLGSDTAETQRLYDAGWAYLNGRGDQWEVGQFKARESNGQPDKSVGGFPAMLIGYVAALRGGTDNIARAQVQLRYFDEKPKDIYAPGHIPQFTAIHEVSAAERLRAELKKTEKAEKAAQ